MAIRALDRGGLDPYLKGARMMAPLAVGDLIDGIAFGVLAAASMGSVAPVVMSILAFSGTAQFATASVLQEHGTVATAAVAALAVNSRYLVMGLTLAPAMRGGPVRRLLQTQFLTDASWAFTQQEEEGKVERMIGAGFMSRLAWTLGTVAGVLGAAQLLAPLGGPERLGLDAVYPAFFLYLLMESLGEDGSRLVAAGTAAVVALLLVPVLPVGLPVLGAAAVGLLIGWMLQRRR
jgi:predicted branched-subunit amino acid permease